MIARISLVLCFFAIFLLLTAIMKHDFKVHIATLKYGNTQVNEAKVLPNNAIREIGMKYTKRSR